MNVDDKTVVTIVVGSCVASWTWLLNYVNGTRSMLSDFRADTPNREEVRNIIAECSDPINKRMDDFNDSLNSLWENHNKLANRKDMIDLTKAVYKLSLQIESEQKRTKGENEDG